MKNKQIILCILGIPTILIVLATILFYASNKSMPTVNLLCQWDCGWYVDVKNNGYLFIAGKQCNVAFFPLLPYLWRWLGLSIAGISLFNFFVFITSVTLLIKYLQIRQKTLITYLCVGLIGFFMVPYTESLFFLGSSLLLLGMYKKQYAVLTLGVFIAIFTRSASMIFLVALVSAFLIESIRTQSIKNHFIILYTAAIVFLVTVAVLYWQYLQTGEFFGFFKTHAEWGHHLQWPKFPFTGWHWPVPLTDSFALLIGISCMIILVSYTLSQFPFSKNISVKPLFRVNGILSLPELFTLLYLTGGSLFILLYQGGNLGSINRYMLSTPFYLILLHLLASKKIIFTPSYKPFLIVLVIFNFAMPHTYPEHQLFIITSSVIFTFGIFYALPMSEKKWTRFHLIACALGLLLQGVLFANYLQGKWMG